MGGAMVQHRKKRRISSSGLPKINPAALFYSVLLGIVLIIVSYELSLLRTELLVKDILKEGINYDAFREMKLSEEVLEQSGKQMNRILKKYPDLRDKPYMDPIGYLTFSMLANDFNMLKETNPGLELFVRSMGKLSKTHDYVELYGYYRAILSDLKVFPVPSVMDGDAYITYEDTWNVLRKYGGNRRHEGTDLMASNNERGYFPVLSMTDGIIENMGWLEQGGYRIGIRSASGGYFYYAHLNTYAPGIKAGDSVIAGQLIGFMGDSGYGEEGTTGQFAVHLHLGIYVAAEHGEMSVNPYQVLRMLEDKRTKYIREAQGSFN